MPINSLGMRLAKRIGMRKAKAPVARNTAITSSLHPARRQIGEEGGAPNAWLTTHIIRARAGRNQKYHLIIKPDHAAD